MVMRPMHSSCTPVPTSTQNSIGYFDGGRNTSAWTSCVSFPSTDVIGFDRYKRTQRATRVGDNAKWTGGGEIHVFGLVERTIQYRWQRRHQRCKNKQASILCACGEVETRTTLTSWSSPKAKATVGNTSSTRNSCFKPSVETHRLAMLTAIFFVDRLRSCYPYRALSVSSLVNFVSVIMTRAAFMLTCQRRPQCQKKKNRKKGRFSPEFKNMRENADRVVASSGRLGPFFSSQPIPPSILLVIHDRFNPGLPSSAPHQGQC